MRPFFTVMLVSLATLSATPGSGSGIKPGEEKLYGDKLTLSEAVAIKEILAHPDEYNKKEVLVEGVAGEVCENKGCWMFLTDGSAKVRVDFKNYGFFVPWDSEGKRVRIQGKVYKKLISREVAKHWAEEQKSPDVKPEDIKEDQAVVMITASGVLMESGSDLSDEQKEVIEGKTSKED